MTDMELAEEIEKYGLSPHLKDQIIAALRRGPELDQTYIVDGRGMRLCDCPNESKCQRGFQRTLATAEFSRCLLPIDHRQFNWFRCSFTKRPPSGEMVMVPRQSVGALDFLLTRIGSWTTARWDQHLRHEFGDERAEVQIQDLKAMLSAAEASKEAK